MDLNNLGNVIPAEMGNDQIKRKRFVVAFVSKLGNVGIYI